MLTVFSNLDYLVVAEYFQMLRNRGLRNPQPLHKVPHAGFTG
jgi:hypothetical protein